MAQKLDGVGLAHRTRNLEVLGSIPGSAPYVRGSPSQLPFWDLQMSTSFDWG